MFRRPARFGSARAFDATFLLLHRLVPACVGTDLRHFSRRVWILRSLTRHRWQTTLALLTITVCPLRCPSRDSALLHIKVSRPKQHDRVIRCLRYQEQDPPVAWSGREQGQSRGCSAQTDMDICDLYLCPRVFLHQRTATRKLWNTAFRWRAWLGVWIKLQKRLSLEWARCQTCPPVQQAPNSLNF